MNSARTDSCVFARLYDEDAVSVHIDIHEHSIDSSAKCWCPYSGSTTMHDQGRKSKGPGTGRRAEYLAKIKERCSVDSSQCHSHERILQYFELCRGAGGFRSGMGFW